jgi:hypothetical protein
MASISFHRPSVATTAVLPRSRRKSRPRRTRAACRLQSRQARSSTELLLAVENRLGIQGVHVESGHGRHELVAAHADERADAVGGLRKTVLGQGTSPRLGMCAVTVDQSTIHVEGQGGDVDQPAHGAGGASVDPRDESRGADNMINRKSMAVAVAVGVVGLGAVAIAQNRPAANMSFFVTSANPKGGNLGGLAGGDQVCQSLAQAPAPADKTWHAYLSTSTVDAKTRIGNGPWYNYKGQLIAQNVADLHTRRQEQDLGRDRAHREGHDARTTSRWWTARRHRPRSRCSTTSSPARTRMDKNADTCNETGRWATAARRRCSATRSPRTQSRRELVEPDPRVAGLRLGAAGADRRRGLL